MRLTRSTADAAAPLTHTRRSTWATWVATGAHPALRERPQPSVAAEEVQLVGTRSARFRLRTPAGSALVALPLPGLYNVYNALGAASLCLALGVPLETVVAGLQDVRAAFGRAEIVNIDGSELAILLVKNPAGANEILRTLVLEAGELDVLGVLNDGVADGRDVSWIWDADFEILASRVRRVTCAGHASGRARPASEVRGHPSRAPPRRSGSRGCPGRGAR